MRWLLILGLLILGCAPPHPAPPGAPTAPALTVTYAPPVQFAIPAAAIPSAVYYGFPDSYGVMLCIDIDGTNFLCWPPPVSGT